MQLNKQKMEEGTILRSDILLGDVTRNIGSMLLNNLEKLADSPAFAEKKDGHYGYRTWEELCADVFKVAAYLTERGLKKGDRIAFVSWNSYRRLVCEMAVMALGMVSVPIFAGYRPELMKDLLEFSEVKLWAIEDESLPDKIPKRSRPSHVLMQDMLIAQPKNIDALRRKMQDVAPDDLAMIMFTSGTTTFPKGVMLSHRNILSQQKALELLWNIKPGMRFLCYLPWHHSFGGLFERFFALHSGGCLAIDDSAGKNVDALLENFAEVKPHVYFSVPKVYQEIISRVLGSKKVEDIFFHPELRFVFTAAAPLPLSISDIFKSKNIPVVEGWGLTETAPCCTLTDFSLDRHPGVVGFPIPDVEIKLGAEDEILVRGPNIMQGYFKQPEATAAVKDENGWFHTGDIGKITDAGVKILSRKDRIFKLDNGEKVFPAGIEESISKRCKFIKYAYVFGKGRRAPMALLFPNYELLSAKSISSLDKMECVCPNRADALSCCMRHCLQEINQSSLTKFTRIGKAVLIDKELSMENDELTPSFKLIPRNIEKIYKDYIGYLETGEGTLPANGYLMEMERQ